MSSLVRELLIVLRYTKEGFFAGTGRAGNNAVVGDGALPPEV